MKSREEEEVGQGEESRHRQPCHSAAPEGRMGLQGRPLPPLIS